jgi:hypothetical protein
MPEEGRNPLDHVDEGDAEARARRFAEIERRQGDAPGAKEMAMTKRPRDEDAAKRAGRFLDIERKGE